MRKQRKAWINKIILTMPFIVKIEFEKKELVFKEFVDLYEDKEPT